jgi:hypothetical protein
VPLALPMLGAFLQGRAGGAAIALAIAAFAAFLAHEPMLIAFGRRGRRAEDYDRPRAMQRVWMLSAVFAISGAIGFALSPVEARVAAVAVGWMGAIALSAAVLGVERGAGAQFVAATVLPAASLPVALAAGVPLPLASASLLSWVIAFSLATLVVRTILARRRRSAATLLCLGSPIVLASALFASGLPSAPAVALLPVVAVGLAVLGLRPSPRRVGRIGLAFAAAGTMTLAVLVR